MAIPKLLTVNDYPALLRFRHSSKSEFRNLGDSLDRVQWLVTRLAHAVEELSHRMERPVNPVEKAELAILAARLREIQEELEPALKAAARVETQPEGNSIPSNIPNRLKQRDSCNGVPHC